MTFRPVVVALKKLIKTKLIRTVNTWMYFIVITNNSRTDEILKRLCRR